MLPGCYGAWRNRFRIVTVLAGSGAFFVVVAQEQRLAEIITAFVGTWAILDIIFMPDKKHELHADLCQEFTGLAAEIQKKPKTRASLQELKAERLTLERREPPCRRIVDLEARNDELRARNFPPDDFAPLHRAQRFFGYYGATFGMDRLEKWKAEQHRNAETTPTRTP
jgi:hypothetical protein